METIGFAVYEVPREVQYNKAGVTLKVIDFWNSIRDN